MSILLLVIILAVLVLAHEFGHFIAAKKSGVCVEEFGIGFPPRIFKFKKGETVYSVGAIPFGGFVRIKGEDDVIFTQNDSSSVSALPQKGAETTDSFSSKPVGVRAIVIAAGVFFNLILAWVMLAAILMIGAPMRAEDAPKSALVGPKKVIVVEVEKKSPAETAGLKAGDELIGFASSKDVRDFASANLGKEIILSYRRGKTATDTVIGLRDELLPEQGAIGIAMEEVVVARIPFYLAPLEALKGLFYLTIGIAGAMWGFLRELIMGRAGMEAVSGPVGIVGMVGDAAALGFVHILNLMVMLSVNLAIINIFPFPALDGGQLLFLLVEKIKGSRLNPKYAAAANAVGFALLIALMVFVTYHDILKMGK